jgi:hypothetical protein
MIARCQPTLTECGPEMMDGKNEQKKKNLIGGSDSYCFVGFTL